MPELRQLRAFVALAEELELERAAERLGLGQQAVSKSVGQLERELGVALLERTTREVRLTPAGLALLMSGREALAAADSAFQEAQAVGRGFAGIVRVGVTPAIDPAALEELSHVLMDGAPDVSVSFQQVRPDEVGELLRERGAEFVLARTAPDAPEVESAPLRPSPAEGGVALPLLVLWPAGMVPAVVRRVRSGMSA